MIDVRRDLPLGATCRLMRVGPTTPTRRTSGSACSTSSPGPPGTPRGRDIPDDAAADGPCRRRPGLDTGRATRPSTASTIMDQLRSTRGGCRPRTRGRRRRGRLALRQRDARRHPPPTASTPPGIALRPRRCCSSRRPGGSAAAAPAGRHRSPPNTELPDRCRLGARPGRRGHRRAPEATSRRRCRCSSGSARTAGSSTPLDAAGRATASRTSSLVPRRGRGGRGLLRAVRRRDGDDGAQPRHPGPGRGRLPAARAGRPATWSLQHPRPARLARAVLRGRRLGPLRAHAAGRATAVPSYTPRAGRESDSRPGTVDRNRTSGTTSSPEAEQRTPPSPPTPVAAARKQHGVALPVYVGAVDVLGLLGALWLALLLAPAPARDRAARRCSDPAEAAWASSGPAHRPRRRLDDSVTARPGPLAGGSFGAPAGPGHTRGRLPERRPTPRRARPWAGSFSALEESRYSHARRTRRT